VFGTNIDLENVETSTYYTIGKSNYTIIDGDSVPSAGISNTVTLNYRFPEQGDWAHPWPDRKNKVCNNGTAAVKFKLDS
jgi:hypothetical protein